LKLGFYDCGGLSKQIPIIKEFARKQALVSMVVKKYIQMEEIGFVLKEIKQELKSQ
jgi:hypothetical protein